MNGGRIKKLLFTAAAMALLALPQAALACSVCFGKSDSSLLKGMHMGVLALLAIVVFVLGGFAAFFIYLVKRSAMIAESTASPPASTQELSSAEIVAIHE